MNDDDGGDLVRRLVAVDEEALAVGGYRIAAGYGDSKQRVGGARGDRGAVSQSYIYGHQFLSAGKEQFRTIAAPVGRKASADGDLPAALTWRRGLDIHLITAGFVGNVGDVLPVSGELELLVSSVGGADRDSLLAGRTGRKRNECRLAAEFVQDQIFSIWRPGERALFG